MTPKLVNTILFWAILELFINKFPADFFLNNHDVKNLIRPKVKFKKIKLRINYCDFQFCFMIFSQKGAKIM